MKISLNLQPLSEAWVTVAGDSHPLALQWPHVPVNVAASDTQAESRLSHESESKPGRRACHWAAASESESRLRLPVSRGPPGRLAVARLSL